MLCVLLAGPTTATAAKPSPAIVERLLERHYVGTDPADYPELNFHWRLTEPPRYGKPRRVRGTSVFPVAAWSRYTICFPDGNVRRDTLLGDFVFFIDPQRGWTFRVRGESGAIGHPRRRACPIVKGRHS